jgi:antitoxin CcdA
MRTVSTMSSVETSTSARTSPSRPAAKRAVNLSLSADILEAARLLKINLSQVCDSHLREVVHSEQARRWREEHAGFIEAYNATLETEGLPLDAWRTF